MVNNIVAEALYRINLGQEVPKKILKESFHTILTNSNLKEREVQLGALLTGLMAKTPTKQEVITLIETAIKQDKFNLKKKIEIKLPNNQKIVGAIGSGKKGIKTMNISTPAMIVAAAAGAYVIKPASTSTSSLTGSLDLCQKLGIKIYRDINKTIEIFKKTGLGIFSIENQIPKFDKVYGGKFFAPQILSFALAGLICPIKLDGLLYGLAHPNVDLSIDIFKHYNYKNVFVVSTTHDNIHYIDEMGVYGKTIIKGIVNNKIGAKISIEPLKKLNLPKYNPKDISQGKNIKENIKYVIDILKGYYKDKAREDIICINAANLLYLSDIVLDLNEGFILAKKTIREGKAYKKLREIIIISGGNLEMLKKYE